MKKMILIVCAIAVVAAGLMFSLRTKIVAAEDKSDKYVGSTDNAYNVYYEVSNYELHVLKNVRLIETAEVQGETFLIVASGNKGVSRSHIPGIIKLDAVKAVLPVHFDEPESTIYVPENE